MVREAALQVFDALGQLGIFRGLPLGGFLALLVHGPLDRASPAGAPQPGPAGEERGEDDGAHPGGDLPGRAREVMRCQSGPGDVDGEETTEPDADPDEAEHDDLAQRLDARPVEARLAEAL